MKKVLILCVCLIGFLNADWKRVMGSSDAPLPPVKEVMKSDTLGVFIRTAVFGFNEQDTTVDNKDFKRITIPEELIDWDTTNAGKPQIPYIRLLIAVPDSCEFNITVYESDYTLFEDYLIYPIPRIVFEETSGCFCSKEVYTYDATFYQKDTLYPDKFYEVISDGHWRDQRVLEVFLYPVQFNPQQKLMYFYTGLDLRIEYSGEVVENENGLGPFEEIGREILLNYPGIDKEPESVPAPAVHYYTVLQNPDNVADYIIVTHEDFLISGAGSYWIDEFARWRVNHNQFDVGVVTMEDVYEEFLLPPYQDSAEALRNFLVYAYHCWDAPSISDDHFAYCLFIGDWDYVPTRLYWHHYDGNIWYAADEDYFRDLSSGSNDDIMLGRWPAKATDVEDLVTIAQKTINYESEPDVGPNVLNWRRRGLLIAGSSQFDGWITESKPYFSDIEYDTLTVRRSQFGNNVQEYRDSITHYLNHGEILSAYYGHGSHSGWSAYYSENLMGLENEDRLPVVLSAACFTGSFQCDHPYNIPGATCFGENFIFKSGGGCVAFYGATRAALIQSGLSILNNILCRQRWIFGRSLVNFILKRDYCLLGDPALDLGDYTALPDYPDLVVRPQGIDISLLSPYPYPSTNDVIPIEAKIWNVGGAAAHNVDVKFEVGCEEVRIYNTTVTIEEIQPRDTAVVTVYWNTALTHHDYLGEIGDCDFWVKADPNGEIEESWEYNNASSTTKSVFLYPSGWSKKVSQVSQPAIANLDGVGSVEIVYPSFDSVYVFNPEGNLVSPWPKYFKNVYGIVLGDIDNNGTVDIVAVSPESIKVYDYQGNILPDWPQLIPYPFDYRFTGLPALGRIESGVSDVFNVVIAAKTTLEETRPIKIFVYNRQGLCVHEFNTTYQVTRKSECSGVSIADIVSGGNNEIVISYVGRLVEPSTEIFNYNGLIDSLNYGGPMISALVDLDNDGYAEVITGGSDKKIRAYKATTGQILWERETEGPINCSPAVGDIHPGLLYPGVEVTFGNDASRVHLRWGINGDPIYPWPDTVGRRVRTSPAIAHISGDKYLDIIVGANNGYIYAFKHTTERIAPYPLPLFGRPSSPVIGDIDGDRKNEVILSSSDGYLHVWENMDSKVLPYLLEWPQYHHDYQRTGLYGWVGGLRDGDANPKTFSTGTTLSFFLKKTHHTKIKIYDAEANLVKTMVNQTLPQGTHNLAWFGKDDNYTFLPNGIYFIEIKVKNESKIIPVEINR
ncbi:hypothetical protein ES705_03265 [subsurface metagenome]